MLPYFNAGRLKMRLRKEQASLDKALDRQRRAHTRAWKKAEAVSDYLRTAGLVLAEPGLPGKLETRIWARTPGLSTEVQVDILLESVYIGRFLVSDSWEFPFWVAART